MGLPKVNSEGKPYTYWVTEVVGSTPGFYPVYEDGEDKPTTTTDGSGNQTLAAFTNKATRFKLDKVNDYDTDSSTGAYSLSR